MAAVSGLFVVFVLVFTVGGGLLLYSLVRGEHGQRQTMDRATAEQVARRDTGENAARDRDGERDDPGNHWGDDRDRGDDQWDRTT